MEGATGHALDMGFFGLRDETHNNQYFLSTLRKGIGTRAVTWGGRSPPPHRVWATIKWNNGNEKYFLGRKKHA